MGKPWTPAEDEALQAMVAAGRTNISMSIELDRPRQSIFSRLKKLEQDGQIPLRLPPADKAKSSPQRHVARTRQCMCCRKEFVSDGPHHRLCAKCRTRNSSPYAP